MPKYVTRVDSIYEDTHHRRGLTSRSCGEERTLAERILPREESQRRPPEWVRGPQLGKHLASCQW